VYNLGSRWKPASEPSTLRRGQKRHHALVRVTMADYDRFFALLVTGGESYSRILDLLGRPAT